MGEKSKSIGEYGEGIVQKFLNAIGWTDCLKGIEVPCVNEDHDKETHGIDFAFLYHSSLIDFELNRVYISVKYSDNPYPASPKSKFKAYFNDLIYALDCFQLDNRFNEWKNTAPDHTTAKDIGVLFWLTNDTESDSDLISKVSNAIAPSDAKYDQLYLVDNSCFEFIKHSLSVAQKFQSEFEYSFLYPDTGKNINPSIRRDNGKILPVEYLTGSIIPIRLDSKTDTNKNKLLLFTKDSFEGQGLKRIISLAQVLSKSWPSEVLILYKDYNELRHIEEVNLIKSSFEAASFTKKVRVASYMSDAQNLQF